MSMFVWFCGLLLSLLLCPLLSGLICKLKGIFVGCPGPSVWQPYYDIIKLLRKGSVYSQTTTWVLPLAPLISLAAMLCAMLFLPFAFVDSPLAFEGDVIVFFYFLAGARVISVLAAMDTGSSFAGMGASREMQFSSLAELGMFCILAFLVMTTGNFSMSGLLNGAGILIWSYSGTALLLVIIAFFILLLSENCRVPIDDPDTHLELTMIHEAMVLDYGGPDLGIIHYTAALKLWLFTSICSLIIVPAGLFSGFSGLLLFILAQFLLGVLVAIVEGTAARFRFLKVPQFLLAVPGLTIIAIIMLLLFK
ncbi:MAG: hydrogenase [Oligosphaeraceae bacterium]|nr:hydrogenase [Oligosphaeraceae bacterium]